MAAMAAEDDGEPPRLLCLGWESRRSAVEKRVTQTKNQNGTKEGKAAAASATTITVGASYTTDRMRAEGQSPFCSFGFQVNAIQRDANQKPGVAPPKPTAAVDPTAVSPGLANHGEEAPGTNWRDKLTLEKVSGTFIFLLCMCVITFACLRSP